MTDTGAEIRAVLAAADSSGLYVLTRNAPGKGREPVLHLPGTAYDPRRGQSPQACLRDWASIHTTAKISRITQLGVRPAAGRVQIGLLALVRDRTAFMPRGVCWTRMAAFFPWENRLAGEPDALAHVLRPALRAWAGAVAGDEADRRHAQIRELFGADTWNAALCDARFALLYQAALAAEALRDRAGGKVGIRARHAESYGRIMEGDDRHILASALAQMRRDLALMPLMPALVEAPFTLGGLQKTVQAVLGLPLHTQNFRRDLVRSGQVRALDQRGRTGGGRLARLWQWCDTGAAGPGMPLPLKRP